MQKGFWKNLARPALWICLLGISLSCKKEDERGPEERAENALLIPDMPLDADALLFAMRTVTPPLLPGLPDANADLVTARFGKAAPYLSAGPLKANNIALRELPNQVYINDDLVLDYKLSSGTRPRWTAEGSNSLPAFNIQTTLPMPGPVKISEVPTSILLSDGILLSTTTSPSHTDAYIWQLGDQKGNTVRKTTTANTVSFSPAELSTLQAGENGIIQVAAYNTELKESNGKKFFFVNQTTDDTDVAFR
jgi:hypothetical protein